MSETHAKKEAASAAPSHSKFENTVIAIVLFAALGGAVALKLTNPDAPPILIATLAGTGVAALVYRFLGGIAPDTSMTIGALKLGGTLAALIGVAWFIDERLVAEVPSEQMIAGTLEDLQGEESITSKYANLFLRRVYFEDGSFNYEWRIITTAKLSKGETVPFYFDRGLTQSRSSTRHELVIEDAYYKQPVKIRYVRAADKLLMDAPEKKELAPINESLVPTEPTPGKSALFDWMPVLHAQKGTSPAQIIARLDSSDPIIRRDARAALAKAGKQALPDIKRAMQDSNAPYRIQLGTLSALNEMAGLTVADVSGAPIRTAVAAVTNADATLSDEAFRFLTKFAATGTGSATAGASRIRAKAAKEEDGDFQVVLNGTALGGQVQLRFDEIDCYQGPQGDPRWRFVLVSGTQRVELPERRMIGTKSGNKFPMTPNEKKLVLMTANGKPVRVIAYKPTQVQ